MKTYSYEENKVITKKIVGVYDADSHFFNTDEDARDILKELEDFDGETTEITIKVKETVDLTNE